MLFHPERAQRLTNVADSLGTAIAPSATLLRAVLDMTDLAKREDQSGAAAHIDRLIECGAWTEAALGILDACCPRWQLSRLIYDGGEWYCRLSSQRELPDWLGQAIETHHQSLAMALLKATVEATQQEATADEATTPLPRPAFDNLILCEDFF